jgi:hypothetical protein
LQLAAAHGGAGVWIFAPALSFWVPVRRDRPRIELAMAKRKLPHPPPDAIGIGAFYAEARRDQFARQGIELAQAGKLREARAAARQAEHWDREAKRLRRGSVQ